jgi:hypothetical protein
MRKDDFTDFCQMLDDAYALLAGNNMPSSTAKAMFFRALSSFPIEAVRSGFDAHVKDPARGRFAPKPADIVAQIEGLVADDGRPGSEEAWAMACRASDESETVVWSEEMAQAFAICQPLLSIGDQVGARMAFKESYARQVEDARKLRRPVAWSASLGHDASKRNSALSNAETRGLLSSGEALRLAPPQGDLSSMATLLLANAPSSLDPWVIRARVDELKARLLRVEDTTDYALISRERVEEKKRQIAEAVAAYQGGSERTA